MSSLFRKKRGRQSAGKPNAFKGSAENVSIVSSTLSSFFHDALKVKQLSASTDNIHGLRGREKSDLNKLPHLSPAASVRDETSQRDSVSSDMSSSTPINVSCSQLQVPDIQVLACSPCMSETSSQASDDECVTKMDSTSPSFVRGVSCPDLANSSNNVEASANKMLANTDKDAEEQQKTDCQLMQTSTGSTQQLINESVSTSVEIEDELLVKENTVFSYEAVFIPSEVVIPGHLSQQIFSGAHVKSIQQSPNNDAMVRNMKQFASGRISGHGAPWQRGSDGMIDREPRGVDLDTQSNDSPTVRRASFGSYRDYQISRETNSSYPYRYAI